MLAAAIAAFPFAAFAQDNNATARTLAATCANCHGTDGHSASSEVAALAGLPKELIVQRMNEYKNGKRPASVMHQLAKGYTDQQIESMAGYFAAQKR
jgi:cytochrome c553